MAAKSLRLPPSLITAMSWISGNLKPLSSFSQVSPPSRLRWTASISTLTQIASVSRGSNRIRVTRGLPINGQLSTKSTGSSRQLFPPSSDRNNAPGLVPMRMMFESWGACATDQTQRPFSSAGDGTCSAAPSAAWRNRPRSEPAKTMPGSRSWLQSAQIRFSA